MKAMVAFKIALMRSLKTSFPAVKTTTGCVSGAFFAPRNGARYPNPLTGLWLSTDPAMGEYVPQAPINDEAKKANRNLPGMGGVFNVVNLHVYHYAGNNPVVLVDPDGKTDIDWDNKIIYADLTDIQDMDKANNYLAGFKTNLETMDFKVIARDGDKRSLVFTYTGTLTKFLDQVDPHTLLPDGKTLTIGGRFTGVSGGNWLIYIVFILRGEAVL
jgi:hypothetical protein